MPSGEQISGCPANRVNQGQLKTVDVLYGSKDNAEGARAFAKKSGIGDLERSLI